MTPTNPTPVLDKDPVAWAKHTLAIEQRKHAKCRQELHAASRRIAALEEALRWFLEDPRFVVSVGGNPNVVDRMLAEARRRALGAEGETHE